MTSKFLGGMVIVAGLASMAHASLVLVSPIEQGGTGLGTVNTVLTLQSPANAGIETGCVGWSGSTTTTLGCNFPNSDVQAQYYAPTLTQAGVTSAADLRIVFNASEPNSALDIMLNQLVLTLYSSSGAVLDTHSLAAPILFPTVANGTGNSGFVFKLDSGQASTLQGFIDANGGLSSVHVGLGASVGNATVGGPGEATGGLETFFVEGSGTISSVPEPATMALIGMGLIGLVAAAKRRRA